MQLWNIIQHLDTTQYKAVMYAERKGSLLNNLPAGVPFHTSPYNEGFVRRKVSQLLTAAGRSAYEQRILSLHKKYEPDFWYINTTAMAHIASLAQRIGVRTVAHVSEMPYLLFETVDRESLKAMLRSDLVMGVSNASCDALRIMGVNDPKLLHPSIDLSNIKVNAERVAALRTQLDIPANAFIWGSSGSLIYRKGIDYLPQLASRMKEEGRACYFIWMGGETKNADEYYLRCELAHGGHTNVLLTGALDETYYEHMALIDAFLMLSHEETFGMVNIEAAYLGKPILSFNSGGINDILQPGMGHIVDSWNISDYANAMIALMDGQIPFDADVARTRALQFAPDKLYQQWNQYMSEL